MLKAIAFGLATGAGVQAWRNFPADGPVSPDAAALCASLGVLLAYLAGRARRAPHATAVAVASAEATATAQNHVQLAVVVEGSGGGVGRAPGAIRIPGDDVSWIGARERVLELDELDGMDAAELLDSRDLEGQER